MKAARRRSGYSHWKRITPSGFVPRGRSPARWRSLVGPEMPEDVIAARTETGGVVRPDFPERLVLQSLHVTIHEEAVPQPLWGHVPIGRLDVRLVEVPGRGEKPGVPAAVRPAKVED